MSRFRFTSELPDDQLFQDVLTLNLLSVPQLDQFIGVLLNFLADKCVILLGLCWHLRGHSYPHCFDVALLLTSRDWGLLMS